MCSIFFVVFVYPLTALHISHKKESNWHYCITARMGWTSYKSNGYCFCATFST